MSSFSPEGGWRRVKLCALGLTGTAWADSTTRIAALGSLCATLRVELLNTECVE